MWRHYFAVAAVKSLLKEARATGAQRTSPGVRSLMTRAGLGGVSQDICQCHGHRGNSHGQWQPWTAMCLPVSPLHFPPHTTCRHSCSHFGRQLTKDVMPVRCQPLTTEDWYEKKMADNHLILAPAEEETVSSRSCRSEML